MAKIPQREVPAKIQAREWNQTGRLPSEWRDRLREDEQFGLSYIVYSFGTPIAWIRKDGLIVFPFKKYSVTTSAHQTLIGSLTGAGTLRTLEDAK